MVFSTVAGGRAVAAPGAAEAGDPYRDLRPRFRPGGEAVPAKSSAIRLAGLLGPEMERRVLAAHLRRSDYGGIDDRRRVQVLPSLTANAQRLEIIGSARKSRSKVWGLESSHPYESPDLKLRREDWCCSK
ncbi:hypothetical protein [Streptomyces sp. NBC_00370]|uniref:hypothetical protein n=1 Tax=Streptomyces sp. NBC_00370 TaxID=2975728 RepID=UPI002E25D64B